MPRQATVVVGLSLLLGWLGLGLLLMRLPGERPAVVCPHNDPAQRAFEAWYTDVYSRGCVDRNALCQRDGRYVSPCVEALWRAYTVPVTRTPDGPAGGSCCGAGDDFWPGVWTSMDNDR